MRIFILVWVDTGSTKLFVWECVIQNGGVVFSVQCSVSAHNKDGDNQVLMWRVLRTNEYHLTSLDKPGVEERRTKMDTQTHHQTNSLTLTWTKRLNAFNLKHSTPLVYWVYTFSFRLFLFSLVVGGGWQKLFYQIHTEKNNFIIVIYTHVHTHYL